jgi:hypothetical protein
MARIVVVMLIVLTMLAAVGIILPAINRAREEEEMRRCQDHLRRIGSYGLLHSCLPGQSAPIPAQDYFPSGTVVNQKLAVGQRLSWYVLVLPAIDRGPVEPGSTPKKPLQYADLLAQIDIEKPWDAEVHQSLAHTRLTFALCPAQRPEAGDGPALTNYLGNGGIGANTAALPLAEAGKHAGVFRYDTPTALETVRTGDGLSNTISVVESARDLSAWLDGGPATVRSLDPDEPPYLGPGRLYAGCHRGRGNFAIADGSVRVLTDRTTPIFFRAMLTIQGNENLDDVNEP